MTDFFRHYAKHYERIGNQMPDYASVLSNPDRYALSEPWLPQSKEARICDIGAGWGWLLLQLRAAGFKRLAGIEISESQFEIARRSLPSDIEMHLGDAAAVLPGLPMFDMFTIFDVIEHMQPSEAVGLLKICNAHLAPGGAVVIRVPNMSNVLAAYSKYMDITHVAGYTEWSLYQLLDAAGFENHEVIPTGDLNFVRWRRSRSVVHPLRGLAIKEFLNSKLHRFLFLLRGQYPLPKTFAANVMVVSRKAN